MRCCSTGFLFSFMIWRDVTLTKTFGDTTRATSQSYFRKINLNTKIFNCNQIKSFCILNRPFIIIILPRKNVHTTSPSFPNRIYFISERLATWELGEGIIKKEQRCRCWVYHIFYYRNVFRLPVYLVYRVPVFNAFLRPLYKILTGSVCNFLWHFFSCTCFCVCGGIRGKSLHAWYIYWKVLVKAQRDTWKNN